MSQIIKDKLINYSSRLSSSPSITFKNQVNNFCKFIDETRIIRNIIEELNAKRKLSDEEIGDAIHKFIDFHDSNIPATEEDALIFHLHLIKDCLASSEQNQLAIVGLNYITETSLQEGVVNFVETHIDPVIFYIADKLDDTDAMLDLLSRYKYGVEWFEGNNLYSLYMKDTKRGESNLDKNLREFLHDQGVDYPWSTPKSPSGEADIIVSDRENSPLVLEVKLFKGDTSYIEQGIRQLNKYAEDYNSKAGYLVVFNVSEDTLIINKKDNKQSPMINYDDKTFFTFVVNLFPREKSAGKSKKEKVCLIEGD